LNIIIQTGADPTKLKLELTENLLAENVDDIGAKMAFLRAHGVSFSLDDFGTGYSSLKYLQSLPFSELKIDRTFVQRAATNAGDASITRAIITLADNLALNVIAEGVETDPQREFLIQNGCGMFQGFLFGKPVALEAFERDSARLPHCGHSTSSR
jgi:EAL domain-containing protein (putative c-di-GMP-specific phosphodiesterase class I)